MAKRMTQKKAFEIMKEIAQKIGGRFDEGLSMGERSTYSIALVQPHLAIDDASLALKGIVPTDQRSEFRQELKTGAIDRHAYLVEPVLNSRSNGLFIAVTFDGNLLDEVNVEELKADVKESLSKTLDSISSLSKFIESRV